MRALISAFSFMVLLSFSANAAPVLVTSGFDKNIEEVKIAKTATFTMGSVSHTMSLVGAALRSKKVVFVPVRIYVGQLFVQDPSTFKKTESEALASTQNQKAIAMHMTFLRDIDADKFLGSFKEGFKANGVDQKDPDIKKFLEMIEKGDDAEKGSSLAFVGYKKDDKTETVVYQNTKGVVSEVSGPEGFRLKIFSLWLGKSDDSGVLTFKKEMLK